MWKKVPDILPRHMQQLQNPNTAQAQETVSRCAQIGCRILTPEDEQFPELLRNIYGVPAVLYVLGDLSCLQGSLSIAMVGRRSCSYDGMRVATEIARRLAQQQAVVVSGMAKGIDAACIGAPSKRREKRWRCWAVVWIRYIPRKILRCGTPSALMERW